MLALLVGLGVVPASAQDATWLAAPGSNNFNAGANWSTGTVPTGTANFGASTITNVGISQVTTLGGITFTASAPAYTITTDYFASSFTFNGIGIVNAATQQQTIAGGATFTNNASIAGNVNFNGTVLMFRNASSAGSATMNSREVDFFDVSSAGTAHIAATNLYFYNSSSAGTANLTRSNVIFNDTSTAGSAIISEPVFLNASTAGNATLLGAGFRDNSSAGNATIINAATFSGNSTAANANITSSVTQFFDFSTAANAVIHNNFFLIFFNESTGGNARIINGGNTDTDFSDGSSPTHSRNISVGSIEGAGFFSLGANQLTVGGNNLSTIVTGTIANCARLRCFSGPGERGGPVVFSGSLVKVGTGTLTLTGPNTYTGPTTVLGGALIVNGSINSPVTVAQGASFGGFGTLNQPSVCNPPVSCIAGPLLTVNGMLVPGASASQVGTLTVNGDVAFGSTAIYQAKVAGSVADLVAINGAATLGGTLSLVPLGGPYRFGSPYTLLSATGGITGTFNTTVQSSFGVGVTPTVSYSGTSVLLTLAPALLTPSSTPGSGTSAVGALLPQNQLNVARGLDRSVFQFGADPTPLFNLYNLPAGQLPAGLASLSGEVHTSVAAMGVDEGSGFLRVMLDPFAVGRSPGANPTLAYADSAVVNPALGAVDQAADLAGPAPLDARRFAVWGAAFGSTGHTNGDGTIGSSRRQLSDANLAVGVDVRLDPQTVVGFAAAGGGAHASLDNGLGSASADVWQIGAYVMRRDGPWSLGGAIAYSWLGVDTTRQVFVLAVPSLNAHTTAHGFSGRIEGAYEVGQWSGLAIAPFAAFEGHAVNAPGFLETNLVGAPIGLAGQSHTNTTTRTELGVKLDGKTVWGGMDVTSFAKLAWAHYFDRDAVLNASLVGFAGSNFTVLGARPDRDSALLSAGLDVKLTPLISLGGRIDGELSGNVAQVSGSARLRVAF